jgi:hypothetical protein
MGQNMKREKFELGAICRTPEEDINRVLLNFWFMHYLQTMKQLIILKLYLKQAL